MREYREPTCANFLKEPFILGVRLLPLLLLTFLTCLVQVLAKPYLAAGIALFGYGLLRLHAKYGKNGSEEALIFLLEKKLSKPRTPIEKGIHFEFQHPDTMDREDKIYHKSLLEDEFHLPQGESVFFTIKISPEGASLEKKHA